MKVFQILNETDDFEDPAHESRKAEIAYLEKMKKGMEHQRQVMMHQLSRMPDVIQEPDRVTMAASPVKLIPIPGSASPMTNWKTLYVPETNQKAARMIQQFQKTVAVDKQYDIQIKELTVKDHTFCFTGFRDATLEAKINALGGRVVSATSGKTDFVVAEDPNSGSGKIQKAKDLGIAVMSKARLKQILDK